MKKFSSFLGKGVVALFGVIALVTLAYASQTLLKASTYYTAASTTTNTVSRIAPTGNIVVDIITTAMSGVPAVTPWIQGVDYAGNAWNICQGDTITPSASAVQAIHVGPALTAGSAAVGTTTMVRCSAVVPDQWRVNFVNASGVGSNGITATTYSNTSP